jgi:citrate lyase subunit beta/citryl-CoA lyase
VALGSDRRCLWVGNRRTPGETEVAYAERVVAAFAEAEAAGNAAIQLDGKFIDYPILYRAQRVLEKIAAIRAKGVQR